jgi:hypothetical protein
MGSWGPSTPAVALGFSAYHATVGVSFDVLSYAGVLGVTVVTDPEIVTEPDTLISKLIQVFVMPLEP